MNAFDRTAGHDVPRGYGNPSLTLPCALIAPSLQVQAYKVTLKTPSGEQVIECADDVYILDAAEVLVHIASNRNITT